MIYKKSYSVFILLFVISFESWGQYRSNDLAALGDINSEQHNILVRSGFRYSRDEDFLSDKAKIDSGEICALKYFGGVEGRIFGRDVTIRDSMDSLKKLPKQCLKIFLRNYIGYKEYFDEGEIEAYCSRSSARKCTQIQRVPDIYKVNVLELLDAISYENGSFRGCLEKPVLLNWNEIDDLYAKVKQVEECRELKVGEARVVEGRSAANLGQSYTLEKTDEKSYDLAFYINFNNTDIGQTDPAEMKKRIDSCLEQVNKNAKGPLGNQFNFKVYGSSDIESVPVDKRPPLTEIEIMNANTRSNSGAYASDIDCDTIVHELLHLTGLVDEYEERLLGHYVNPETGLIVSNPTASTITDQQLFHKKIYNDCRAISTTPSIMASSNGFLSRLNPQPKVCACSPEGVDTATLLSCEDMMRAPKDIKDLFVKSKVSLRTFVPNFSRYCIEDSSKERIWKDFTTFDELKEAKVLGSYKSFDNGRTLMDYSYFNERIHSFAASRLEIPRICACDVEKVKCRNFLAKLDEFVTGSGDIEQNIPYCPGELSEVKFEDGAEKIAQLNQVIVNNIKPDNSLNLLREAHVQKILYPGCNSVAPKYIACSTLFQKEFKRDCPDRPDFCDNESEWLGK